MDNIRLVNIILRDLSVKNEENTFSAKMMRVLKLASDYTDKEEASRGNVVVIDEKIREMLTKSVELQIDFTKHLSTLSATTLVLVFAILRFLGENVVSQGWYSVSIIMLVFSLITSLSNHIALLGIFRIHVRGEMVPLKDLLIQKLLSLTSIILFTLSFAILANLILTLPP
jgi:hypothetical protein